LEGRNWVIVTMNGDRIRELYNTGFSPEIVSFDQGFNPGAFRGESITRLTLPDGMANSTSRHFPCLLRLQC
jgi:hypothetical protein